MQYGSVRNILEQIEHATIVSSDVDDDSGFHIFFDDGRALVIVGNFYVSLLRVDTERLH